MEWYGDLARSQGVEWNKKRYNKIVYCSEEKVHEYVRRKEFRDMEHVKGSYKCNVV